MTNLKQRLLTNSTSLVKLVGYMMMALLSTPLSNKYGEDDDTQSGSGNDVDADDSNYMR